MKNKPNLNMLRCVEFKARSGRDQVTGFCVEETNSFLKIASTFGNQGFMDITVVDKSKIVKLSTLILSSKKSYL